ncbi:MAG: 3',5'-cyclic-nucleotide phosphodiesterase [Bacteriovoracaceae bacterium]|jgi:ribonuclease BN (tRNA processing enzyme)|nr:3',5'-cyclic-nucleotide phosphodiesterase [Bacteriovoracaceae bacterium]
MLVRIIGGSGGVCPGHFATSYLIDGTLLIDAGSCANGIQIDEQAKIDNILISHPHLDHIKDLAFICDNCFGMKGKPFEVHTNKTISDSISKYLLNDVIWPDFTKLPTQQNPTIRFNEIEVEKKIKLGDYTITAIPVNHPCDAIGFIIERGNSAIVFTQDTAPTEKIWKFAKQTENVKAIFTEVSFPNSLKQVAVDSQHHTPDSMKEEILKMPPSVPIFLGHLKPNFHSKLYEEIALIGSDRVTILGTNDQTFVF